MKEILVKEFRKNSREYVRATLRTWNGKELVDIRVFCCDANGTLHPTSKGLCLRLALLPEFRKMVNMLPKDDLFAGEDTT